MKTTVTVKDRQEAAAVCTAWNDQPTRALILIMGTLLQLPNDRARYRVLQFVTDKLAEDAESR